MTGENSLDSKKLLSSKAIRINLLLSSLYLTAFEILKATLIEGVAGIIVYLPEPDEAAILEWKDILPEKEFKSFYEMNVTSYKRLVKKYEQELGIKFDERHRFGLIPSCRWLQAEGGILLREDIEAVREMRDHRNAVAHELPTLLISKGFSVNLGYLEQMMNLVRKVGPFFARLGADIPANIPDEDIMSGGQIIFGVILNAVHDYLQQLSQ